MKLASNSDKFGQSVPTKSGMTGGGSMNRKLK
jgi:hypothetical protein